MIAAEVRDRWLQIRAAYESGWLQAFLEGNVEDAVARLRGALSMAEEENDRALQIGGHMRLGSVLFNAGELLEAQHHLRACIELASELGSRRDEARATCMLGILHGYRGDTTEAERLAGEARDWLERTGDSHMQIQNLRTLARAALRRGDTALAEDQLREALPLALEGADYLVVEVYRYLVEVLVQQGRVDEARDLVAFAARNASVEHPYARAALLIAEALVATAAEEPVSATGSFGQALQLLAEQDLIVDLAEARLLYARALRSFGEQTGARTELELARVIFKRLGADPILPEIDRELEELAAAGAGQAGPGSRTS